MAHNEDVDRILVECVDCGSVHVARQWPSGDIRVVGRNGCDCGSSDFTPVESTGGDNL